MEFLPTSLSSFWSLIVASLGLCLDLVCCNVMIEASNLFLLLLRFKVKVMWTSCLRNPPHLPTMMAG